VRADVTASGPAIDGHLSRRLRRDGGLGARPPGEGFGGPSVSGRSPLKAGAQTLMAGDGGGLIKVGPPRKAASSNPPTLRR
jgi:hypothetical protein